MLLYQTIPLIFFIILLFFSIKILYYTTYCFYHFYSTSIFMKNRRSYKSNDISLQLCLCIVLEKGYIPKHYLCKYSNWNLNAIFYWKLSHPLLGVIIFEKTKNPLCGILSYFDTGVPTTNKQLFLTF